MSSRWLGAAGAVKRSTYDYVFTTMKVTFLKTNFIYLWSKMYSKIAGIKKAFKKMMANIKCFHAFAGYKYLFLLK